MSKFVYPALLLVIILGTHTVWLDPHSILSFADWSYWPTSSMHELWSTWGTWLSFSDFGTSNIQLSFLFFKSIWGFVEAWGGTYDTAVRITFLLPIIVLSALSPYYFAFHLTNNKFAAFCGTLFFSSTTFFLIRQTAHLPIALVYAMSPLILLLFDKALLSRKETSWVLFLLIFWIGSCYEIRIMYVISVVLIIFLFFVRPQSIAANFRNLIATGCLFVLMSTFWLLPVVLGGVANDVTSIANRGLFGSHLFSIQQALTIFESSWTDGYPNMDFVPQPIPLRFWIFPALVAISIYIGRKTNMRNWILFFSFLSVLGIFLTKQADIPGEGIYEWLYKHFPGFNLFREASKFYLITSLGYFGLLTALLVNLKRSIYRYTVGGIILCLALINLVPLVTRDINTLFVSRTIPYSYVEFGNLLHNKEENFKTLWFPTYSRWSPHSVSNQKVSIVRLLEKGSNDVFYDINDTVSDLRRDLQVAALLRSRLFPILLRSGSVKYLVVPPQDVANDDDFYRYYGGKLNVDIRNWYESQLDITSLLKLSNKNDALALYENSGYKQNISAFNTLITFPSNKNIESHLVFAETLKSNIDFSIMASTSVPSMSIQDMFENLNTSNIKDSTISLLFDIKKNSTLFIPASSTIVLEKQNIIDVLDIGMGFPDTSLPMPFDGYIQTNLSLASSSYINLIKNPSFEDGPWRDRVGDCNNHDDDGKLSMGITDATSTNGIYALYLGATRHVACTYQEGIIIEPNALYYLQFDYQTVNSHTAGYYLGFTKDEYLSKRIVSTDSLWHTYSRFLKAPNSTSASFYLYSYEEERKKPIEQIVHYDNIYLIKVPDILGRMYVVNNQTNFNEPRRVTFDLVHPSKKLTNISGATTPFYLAMSESFHPQWRAELNNKKSNGTFTSWIPWVHPDKIQDDYHFKLDGFLNGWYVDPVELCGEKGSLKEGCTMNEDGSYNIELIIEFTPQRWFYVGLIISGTTLLSCLGYLGYDFVRRRRQGAQKSH